MTPGGNFGQVRRILRAAACCLLSLWLTACHRVPSAPLASPAGPDRAAVLIKKADLAREAGDRENEALALREAVEILATPRASSLEATQAACVQAMVEAGDNAASYRLWKDLVKKNGPSKEADRMLERARKLMLAQADELAAQVEVDLKAARPQAALCTAKASLALYKQAGGEAAKIKKAQALVTRVSGLAPP